jgi:putative membrane protein
MWGFGWGFMFLGPLFMVLVAVAIYFIVTSFYRRRPHVHYSHQYPSQGREIEVLNERFAKGEITREQYLQMRQTMEGT